MSDSNLMRRQANAIYLEVNESTADDVAKSLRTGADAVDRLQRAEELLDMAADSLRAGGLMTVAKRIDAFRGRTNDV